MTLPNRSAQTMRINILPEDQDPELPEHEKKQAHARRVPRPVIVTPHKTDNPQFRELFQSMYDAAILTNMNGCIVDVNARAQEFFGYEKPDFCDLNILDIVSGADETLVQTIRDNVKIDRFTLVEAYSMRANESIFPSEIACSMLTLGDEDLLCFFVRDTTLRIEAEQQIREKNEQLKVYASDMEKLAERRAKQLVHADRMVRLGVMSAGIAHEINNPTTFISSNLEMLRQFQPEIDAALADSQASDEQSRKKREFIIEEYPRVIEGMRNGVDRITRIVRSLKMFSRQGDFERTRCNVNECVAQSLEMCRNAIKKGIDLQQDLQEDIPTTLADGQQLVQIFVNLISNAVHAMKDRSERTLDVSSSSDGSTITVAIADSGTGIPQDKIESIWEPFFTTKPVGEGTGLGLSITHGIVKAHGGKIWAENKPEGGARFILELPVLTEDEQT